MHIQSIELINVRSFKKEKIELSKGINILIGKNNSGKSTIVRSVYNIQSGNSLGNGDVRRGSEALRVFIEISEINEQEKKLFYNNKEPHVLPESDKQVLVFSITANEEHMNERLYYDAYLKTERLKNDRLKIMNNEGKEVQMKELPVFPKSEDKHNFIYPFLSHRKTDYFHPGGGREETFRVEETLRYLVSKVQKLNNPSHNQHEKFKRLCKEILNFNVGVIPGEQNHQQDLGIYTSSSEVISIRSMGDGVANVLGLIVILLTEDEKLFLIEELENDIHPSALKKLLNLIIEKSDNNQFIVSTHSNIILKYLGSAERSKMFYTEWTPNDQTDNKRIPTSTISELEISPKTRTNILKELGYDFNDFELHESYLIFEESSAEQIIRDFLIPNCFPNLYGRVKTISAKGTSDLAPRVIDFNRLFVFIHTSEIYYKRAWVIADGDKDGIKSVEDLKQEFRSWPEKHFINWKKEKFEYYYPTCFQEEVKRIFSQINKEERRQLKTELLRKVIKWSFDNPKEAIKEFKKSAKEVFEVLTTISKDLGTPNKIARN